MGKLKKINSFILAFGIIFLILRYTIGLLNFFEKTYEIVN